MQVEEAWRRHRQWSALARRRLIGLIRLRRLNVGLVLLGAVLGAVAAQNGLLTPIWTRVVAAVGAAALATAAFIQGGWLTAERVQERVAARAASESLKAVVYQRLSAVGPFAGSAGESRLDDVVDEVARHAANLSAAYNTVEPDTKPMPQFSGLVGYVEERAKDQQNYHKRAAGKRLLLEKRWRAAEVSATLIAALLSAVGGALGGAILSVWVGVATTVASALAAHIASEQHARIAAGYAQTADKLDRLLRRFDPAHSDEKTAATFVADIEQVLNAQNDSWATLTKGSADSVALPPAKKSRRP